MPKYKIAIGFPTGDYKLHQCVSVSLLQMMNGKDWSEYHFDILTETGIYIENNRNKICERFLAETEADYLYFWDYDNGLFPDAFDLYMEGMARDDIHILSGLYFRKEKHPRFVGGLALADMQGYTSDIAMFCGNSGPINLTKMPNVTKAMSGAGALMIKRDVFNNVPKPWFQTHSYRPDELRWDIWGMMTEDVYFCELAQKHGYDIWLDPRIESPHYKGDEVWPKNWHQYERPEEERVDVEVKVISREDYLGG